MRRRLCFVVAVAVVAIVAAAVPGHSNYSCLTRKCLDDLVCFAHSPSCSRCSPSQICVAGFGCGESCRHDLDCQQNLSISSSCSHCQKDKNICVGGCGQPCLLKTDCFPGGCSACINYSCRASDTCGAICYSGIPKKIFEAFSRIFGWTPENSGKSWSGAERAETGRNFQGNDGTGWRLVLTFNFARSQ